MRRLTEALRMLNVLLIQLGHRAWARALASEVVLGHRARARALVWTGFRQCTLHSLCYKLLKNQLQICRQFLDSSIPFPSCLWTFWVQGTGLSEQRPWVHRARARAPSLCEALRWFRTLAHELLVCKWRHGGHVGGQEQKHFSPLGN